MLILCLSHSQFILAAPTTFVDGSDPSCGGNTPCYSWLTLAIQNVDNNGEVVITGDVAQTLNTSHGKTGVTVRGLSGTESINNVALLGPPLVDWVFRDFQPTIAIKIENVSGSLLIQNVKTQVVSIGDFTSDTTANIVVEHSEILPGGAGGISITGADGIDIAGQIDIRDNVIDQAINVQVRGTAEDAVLGADINVLRNEGYLGGGIRGIAPYGSGKATITGDIVVADNVFDPLASKFGVSLAENVEGDFAGNVTMLRNDLAWLAFLNQFSAGGSMLGDLVVSDNYAETIEIDIWGDMVGDVVAKRNRIEYRGGGTGLAELALLLVADTFPGSVEVTGNIHTGTAIIVGSKLGDFSGTALIANNGGEKIVAEALGGGNLTSPLVISDNFLHPSTGVRSTVVIRTVGGGDLSGATIRGNTSDYLQIVPTGQLTGQMNVEQNTVRTQATFNGTLGPGGLNRVRGNRFLGNVNVQDLESELTFNHILGTLAVQNGTSAPSQYNWWGCDGGPGLARCGSATTPPGTWTPWLTFWATSTCAGDRIRFLAGPLAASDSSALPQGHVSTGSVIVVAPDAVVEDSPAPLRYGSAIAYVSPVSGPGTPVQISASLDSETRVQNVACAPTDDLHSDSFESADLRNWS